MKIKSRPEYKSKTKPVTLSPNTMTREAITLMSEGNYGSVIVTSNDNEILGIVTERDLMRRLLHKKKNPDKTKLSEIMTSEVRVAQEDDNLLDWLRIMSNERFRHLPIVDDNGHLVNMMSQGDFVSYTWPELFKRIKENTQATLGVSYQIVFIILAMLVYAAIVNIFS